MGDDHAAGVWVTLGILGGFSFWRRLNLVEALVATRGKGVSTRRGKRGVGSARA